MTPFSAVGLELWSMTSDIFFDNFIICTERAVADDWANDGWGLKKAADGAAEVRYKGCNCVLLTETTLLLFWSRCWSIHIFRYQGWELINLIRT